MSVGVSFSCLKPLSGNVCLRPLSTVGQQKETRQSLKPLSGNVCLRPNGRKKRSTRRSTSQTPLGERVPSARDCCYRRRRIVGVSNPSRGTCAFGPRLLLSPPPYCGCLKPLSGNVCLRPLKANKRKAPLLLVSNPSRGTCAFGLVAAASWWAFKRGLKPLSGNVCLRPRGDDGGWQRPPSVSNPSRGTCAFGPESRARMSLSLDRSQTPLGERVPSAIQRARS